MPITAPSSMPEHLLAGYPAAADAYDEMLDGQQRPRAHWRALLDSLAAEPDGAMQARVDAVQRQVRENGVTYNVYADVKGNQRTWDLNALPLILPHDEWAELEAAVIQRATLLNRILLDVYGPQRLLADGLLPPALVHGQAGFLRPCHGVRHLGNVALHFYALDLARAPDGQWWVVSDRTQAPSGAGYALENRTVISRTFPELLRELNVRNLGPFFDTMRASLSTWGRQCAAYGPGALPLRPGEPPTMVLLTPGPLNETYYEHAYLARHLGLPLVQGSDLTVRQGMVWLKSLSGMQRVHVILRRVDDDFCDPLELRADSALGVAGLSEAARLGNVLITNSLGSSLLESGALLGFLPSLSQQLLGEELKMPSVATWWCGQPEALEQVVANLERLVISPSHPQLRWRPIYGMDLDAAGRKALVAQLHAHPANYVAQELVRLSQAPVWKRDNEPAGLYPCATGLRVYACATPKGYVVMPGGLTRVATGPDARVITMQQGGGSKDTWVQAKSRVVAAPAEARLRTSRDLVRDDTHLSSRMAENLYWLGRNAERCDDVARLLRVCLDYQFYSHPEQRGREWEAMTALCAWFGLLQAPPMPEGTPPLPLHAVLDDDAIAAQLLRAVGCGEGPGLVCQQQALYASAMQLRERLSADNWRALQRMGPATAAAVPPSRAEAMQVLDTAVETNMLMSGYALDGMNRDLGWRFMSLGRRLERLLFQCQLLRRGLAMGDAGELDWMLELSDSVITYRARYQSLPEWLPLLDLLVLDESNPRSIVFQVEGILKTLRKLPMEAESAGGGDALPSLRAELLALDASEDLYGGNPYLQDLLARLVRAAQALSDQVALRYFSHTSKD